LPGFNVTGLVGPPCGPYQTGSDLTKKQLFLVDNSGFVWAAANGAPTAGLFGISGYAPFCVPYGGAYTIAFNDKSGCYQNASSSFNTGTNCNTLVGFNIGLQSYTGQFKTTTTCGGGVPVSGINIAVNCSGMSYSGTTGASGLFSLTLPSLCGCTATASYPGFISVTGSGTMPCASAVLDTFIMQPAAGYKCSSCCPYPLPASIPATDSYGNFFLNYQNALTWAGCHLVSVADLWTCIGASCIDSGGPGNVAVGFTLQCTNVGLNTWTLSMQVTRCTDNTPADHPAGGTCNGDFVKQATGCAYTALTATNSVSVNCQNIDITSTFNTAILNNTVVIG
jgi:hypothetical protein